MEDSSIIIEKDEDWYTSYCAEIPGANGQGKTKEECLKNLSDAIEFIDESIRLKLGV
jgi:predicted RNase H-like HicB family nuclease